jgi:hypothetical protein
MAKKKKTTLPSFGSLGRENPREIKKAKYKQKYNIGANYMIELANNNMLYYKKLDQGIFQIVKAKGVETSFSSKELFELATELGEKLKLPVS